MDYLRKSEKLGLPLSHLGNDSFMVKYRDDDVRLNHIHGKMKWKILIRERDILLAPLGFQSDAREEIFHRCTENQDNDTRREGILIIE